MEQQENRIDQVKLQKNLKSVIIIKIILIALINSILCAIVKI